MPLYKYEAMSCLRNLIQRENNELRHKDIGPDIIVFCGYWIIQGFKVMEISLITHTHIIYDI